MCQTQGIKIVFGPRVKWTRLPLNVTKKVKFYTLHIYVCYLALVKYTTIHECMEI